MLTYILDHKITFKKEDYTEIIFIPLKNTEYLLLIWILFFNFIFNKNSYLKIALVQYNEKEISIFRPRNIIGFIKNFFIGKLALSTFMLSEDLNSKNSTRIIEA